MEDSWRTRREIPTPKLSNYPPRRSTGYTTISDDIRSPEDFTDVFGGPPRTILSHQFPSAGCFYEDIFWQPEKPAAASGRRGRKLPLFRIPSVKQSNGYRYQRSHQNNGFLGDVFGWDSERVVTLGSRSKTSSSSAVSSEELSPLRPAVPNDGYDDVSLFASKLRPINVKTLWDSSRNITRQTKLAALSGSQHRQISGSENDFLDTLKNHPFRFSRKNEFVESMNLEHAVNRSFRVSPDHDLPVNSPSSVVSSLSQSEKDIETCEPDDMERDEEVDDLMSSYVIEINSCYSETACEPNGVDEAIAWAKETFQKHRPEGKPTQEMLNELQRHPAEDEQQHERAIREETSKIEEEIELLDEKIKLWSSGKEADIRMVLSTLHHILWPNSGWVPISTTNLIESSQVKKAYQKAVLCLHPDKLQQRAATLPQKYIAEKAFSALQGSWAAFISMDVFWQ